MLMMLLLMMMIPAVRSPRMTITTHNEGSYRVSLSIFSIKSQMKHASSAHP